MNSIFSKYRQLLCIILASVCNITPYAYCNSKLIEAESFSETGGWVIDQQFMDQMGSPYLLAHGIGTPVSDASTTVDFNAPGVYHVFVRTYNWTSPWHNGHGPGRFALKVNDVILNDTLGINGVRWEWQYAGSVEISNFSAQIALTDMTGFDGRCDAIYFTSDPADIPPQSGPELRLWREEHRNADRGNRVFDFDLVVVGGGIAGMCTAVSAARLGCSVALITDRPVLGGNNSSEVRVHLGGALDLGRYPNLGGLIKEFGPGREGNAQPEDYYEDDKKLQWILAESGISLFLNQHVCGVDMSGNRISAVTAENIQTGRRDTFTAPVFADCTGDGTLGFLAGADYLYGRESSCDFGEPTAPPIADKMTMGSSIQWRSTEISDSDNTSFPIFDYGLAIDETSCQRVDKGEWTWETGMNRHQIDDGERIRDYGLLVVYTNWSYLKNKLGFFPNRNLEWVAFISGKRESRRLLGDYILKEDDMTKHVFHEDGSFTATWSIDLHFPNPGNSKLFPGNEFLASTSHVLIYPYPVPYRCLYSRNIGNLFMAGRNISVTHVALGSVRVMRTTGMMGEVVGMAASICVRKGVSPREVYMYHLDELKDLMIHGVAHEGLDNNQKYNEGGHLNRIPAIN